MAVVFCLALIVIVSLWGRRPTPEEEGEFRPTAEEERMLRAMGIEVWSGAGLTAPGSRR